MENKEIYPKEIYMVSSTQAIIEFEEEQSGYAVLTSNDRVSIYYSLGEITQWDIEHNLDAELVHIQIYDINNDLIIPKEVQYLSNNIARVTFCEPVECFAIIKIADNSPSEYLWTITHNINRREVLTQFSKDSLQLVPKEVLLSDENEVKTTISGGTTLLANYDYLHNQPTESSIWVVDHNFGHAGTLVDVYDMDNNKLYPKMINLINENRLTIEFEKAVSGYAVVVSIGSVYFSEIVKITKVRYSNEDRSETYINDITETWDNEDYIYFRLYIPREVELTINRIELITNSEEVFFETKCSPIYKSNKFTMDTFYRIFKGVI